jgi:hypothetical protein
MIATTVMTSGHPGQRGGDIFGMVAPPLIRRERYRGPTLAYTLLVTLPELGKLDRKQIAALPMRVQASVDL